MDPDSAILADAVCNLVCRIRSDAYLQNCSQRLSTEWSDIIRDEKSSSLRMRSLRRSATEYIRQVQRESTVENEKLLKRAAPPHLQRVLSTTRTRNVVAMRRLARECGHADLDLPECVLKGFQTVGEGATTGLWKHDQKAAEATIRDVHEFYNAAIVIRKHAPIGFPVHALEAIITDIEADVLLGRYREISAGDLARNPAYAFPKVEPSKVRTLVDERWKNTFSRLPEKVRLHGTRTIAEVIRAYMAPLGAEQLVGRMPATQLGSELTAQIEDELRAYKRDARQSVHNAPLTHLEGAASGALRTANLDRQHGPGGEIPNIGLRDWSKAYYMVGVRDPEDNPVAAWDPSRNRYRLWVSSVLNMGNKFSVQSWCRVAELTMCICARIGHIVAPIYIDDAIIFGIGDGLIESLQFYEALSDCLGLELSNKPAARQSSLELQQVKILGLYYRWGTEGGRNSLTISVPEEQLHKLEALAAKLLGQLAEKSVVRKDIQRLLGTANFVSVSSATRAGSEVLRPLYEWVSEDGFAAKVKSRDARRMLGLTIQAVVTIAKERCDIVYVLATIMRPLVALYTDASSDGARDGGPMLGIVLLRENGEIWRTSSPWKGDPDERIEVLEAAAVRLAAETYTAELTGRDVLVLVDNTTTAYGFIKCSSRSTRAVRLAVDTVKIWHKSETSAFYSFVKSEWNIADFYTRWQKVSVADWWLRPQERAPKAVAWNAVFEALSQRVADQPSVVLVSEGDGSAVGPLPKRRRRLQLLTPPGANACGRRRSVHLQRRP